jgi:hypothetical protein
MLKFEDFLSEKSPGGSEFEMTQFLRRLHAIAYIARAQTKYLPLTKSSTSLNKS